VASYRSGRNARTWLIPRNNTGARAPVQVNRLG
jgi:hypothetical protein